MAFEVNSVSWSETIIPGLPRRAITAMSSRATRRPEIEVSGIAARYSRVTSSNPEPATIGHLIVDEIQGPAGIDLGFDKNGCPHSDGTASGSALADGETLLAIEPVYAVYPRGLALPAQQNEQSTVAESSSFVGQIA